MRKWEDDRGGHGRGGGEMRGRSERETRGEDRRGEDQRGQDRESYGRHDRGDSYERHIHGRSEYDPSGRYSDRSNREPYDQGTYSRVGGGPRREEPYRGPSRDEYRPFYEGNVLGDENYSGLPHIHPGDRGHRHPEFGGSREQRGDDRRHEERGGHENRGYENRRHEGENRGYEGRDRDERRGPESEQRHDSGSHDPSHTWRLFDEWGRTSYGNSRSQGLGWRRTDDYGDQFWSNSERNRDDHYE